MEFFSATPATLPLIRNNFMYNYRDNGLLSNGYSGNIGSPSQNGMNTFYGNTAFGSDVFTLTPPINVYGNFGTFAPVPGVNVFGSQVIHSTTSCGHQTLPASSMQHELDYELVCDDYSYLIYPMDMDSGKMAVAAQSKEVDTVKGDVYAAISGINAIAYGYKGDLGKIYDLYTKNLSLTSTQKLMVQYTYEKAGGYTQKAGDILRRIEPANNDEKLWLATEKINLDIAGGTKPGQVALDDLHTNFSETDNLINRVNGILVPHKLVLDLYFHNRQKPHAEKGATSRLSFAGTGLSIYPNPVAEELKVRYILKEGSAHDIMITDAMGKTILSKKLEFDSGEVILDVSQLPGGFYFIHIPNVYGSGQISKFVKK